MTSPLLFDQQYYIDINLARWKAAEHILRQLRTTELHTCLDIGCGPGWFTERLSALRDWDVRGLDGRADLIEIARHRVPKASFIVGNFEADHDLGGLAQADLVFCFGLLYHLENPFRAVRWLRRLTAKYLLIETLIIPGDTPSFWLVEEGRNNTQGLTHMAVIPTRPSLIKMLQAAGFVHVYEYMGRVDHVDFIDRPDRHRRRAIMIAGHYKLELPDTVPMESVQARKYDYARSPGA